MIVESQASIVTIEEREGKKRVLELRGPGLPKRGAAWSSENRLVTEWFPGNSAEATQQVLGPIEAPSDWEGVWNTTRLIGTPCIWRDGGEEPITRADTLQQRFETIARSGALLRVTWAGADGRRIVREGRVGPMKFAYDRFDDLAWSASFVWVSRGDQASNVTSAKDEGFEAALRELTTALADLQSALDDQKLRSAFAGLPDSASLFSLGQLESLASAPLQLATQFSRLITQVRTRIDTVTQIISTIETGPDEVAGLAADTAADTATTCRALYDAFSRQPPELLTTRPDRPAYLGNALHYFGLVLRRAHAAARAAHVVIHRARRRRVAASPHTGRNDRARPADAIRVHRTSAHETFAALALKFYGDAGQAWRIARANNFPAFQVKPGAGVPLFIPVPSSNDGQVQHTPKVTQTQT